MIFFIFYILFAVSALTFLGREAWNRAGLKIECISLSNLNVYMSSSHHTADFCL